MYVVGLLDETEFDGHPEDDARRHPVYGPFQTIKEAQEYGRRLSSDPEEAVVMELKIPDHIGIVGRR